VDAQLSHCDLNTVNTTCNHAYRAACDDSPPPIQRLSALPAMPQCSLPPKKPHFDVWCAIGNGSGVKALHKLPEA